MSFKEDLRTYLLTLGDVTRLINQRIYPSFVTDANKPRPYITFHVSGNENVDHLKNPSSLVRQTVQFDIWANTATDAWNIQTPLRKGLDGLNHTNIGSGPTNIREVRLDDIFDNIEGPNDGGEEPAFRITMVFIFWYIRDTQGF